MDDEGEEAENDGGGEMRPQKEGDFLAVAVEEPDHANISELI